MPFLIHGKHVVVLGDKTTHGGEVITASETVTYLGKSVARIGDKVSCPKCSGVHTIVEGFPSAFDHGKPFAVHDCLTSCGARLIAESGGNNAGGDENNASGIGSGDFSEQFHLINEAGEPANGVKYRINTQSGFIHEGETGIDGKTVRVYTNKSEKLECIIIYA